MRPVTDPRESLAPRTDSPRELLAKATPRPWGFVRLSQAARTSDPDHPDFALACFAVNNLEALLDRVEKLEAEAQYQMGAKLEAQSALLAITRALDLSLSQIGTGWSEGVKHILQRIELIVDESERAFRERDAALARVAGEQP